MVAKSCTTKSIVETLKWDKPSINWCRISSIHSMNDQSDG
jgi:hypothetical protein